MNDDEQQTHKIDIYSFAMIGYELICHQIPFSGFSEIQILKAVTISKKRPELPNDYHPTVKDLIQKCWVEDPNERPEFSVIVKSLENKVNVFIY